MKAKDYKEAWDKQHKFSDPSGWIQWKSTDVSIDVSCECGYHGHVSGYFAYTIKCPDCKRVYFLNGHIQMIEIENAEDNGLPLDIE